MKDVEEKHDYVKQGKKNRAAGVRFEAKTRKDLKEDSWIVDKWTNNIDLEKDKIIPAKRKYNPFMKALIVGSGFPDFICFKKVKNNYEVIGVEVKRKGYLNPEEREKCKWYLKNKIFSKILIARESKENEDKRRTKIEYIDFEKKYNGK